MAIGFFGYYSAADNELLASAITGSAGHSNIVQAIYQPIESDWALLTANSVKIIPNLRWVFFDGSGGLLANYVASWNSYRSSYSLDSRQSLIAAFSVMDEPTLNGVSAANLTTACNLVKATYPSIPIMIIEAYTHVNSIVVPTSVDWLGFDRYFVRNPSTDSTYLSEYATIKSKRSTGSQKMVIVMDATHRQAHTDVGISASDMAAVATNYYTLASGDADVIAMLGFIWDNSVIDDTWTGTESLPAAVLAEHVRIGQLITGKPYADPPPTIYFSSPSPGATVSGTLNAVTVPSANTINIMYYIDNVYLFSEQDAPYGFSLDTTLYADGSHTLKGVAYDQYGRSGEGSVTVTFSNVVEYPALSPTKYLVGGSDLSTILRGRLNTAIANTNFQVGGVDLSSLCEPIASGSGPAATNFKVNGADLNTLFSAVGT